MSPQDEPVARVRGAIEAVLGNRFTKGNRVTPLKNGDEIFPAMLGAIEQARHRIDFVTFVYWTGDIARRFAATLARKASEGVQVRVLLDGFGSLPMNTDLIEQMRAAGAVVERFRPVVRWKLWESDHRTHRKILVCDERIAFTGGVGIAEEWMGNARDPSEWRDTHFQVEGPAVLDLRAAFLTDWRDAGHPIGRPDIGVRPSAGVGTMEVALIDGSAQIGFNDAERMLEALAAAAGDRIMIQTPYFNPDPAIVDALIEARHRSVDVHLLLPGPHIDKRVSAVVAEDEYRPLLDHGVRVWIYQKSMMHVKAVLVDGVASVVGSVNINRRSVSKDEEVAMVVLDRSVTALLEEHFRTDVADSVAAEVAVPEPPLLRRVGARLLRPLKPEM